MIQCPEHMKREDECLDCWKAFFSRHAAGGVNGAMMISLIGAFQSQLGKAPERAAAHMAELKTRQGKVRRPFFWLPADSPSLRKVEEDVLFDHPTLGLLTEDEYRMMRQVPMGYPTAEWTQERLDNIRLRLAGDPKAFSSQPPAQQS